MLLGKTYSIPVVVFVVLRKIFSSKLLCTKKLRFFCKTRKKTTARLAPAVVF